MPRLGEYRPSADSTREAMLAAHRCTTVDLALGCTICQAKNALQMRRDDYTQSPIDKLPYMPQESMKSPVYEEKLKAQEEKNASGLPTGTAARKDIPIARGVLDYFPAALAEVARLSKAGNDKHNPGEDLHWARGKSMDHADCILRHLIDRGTVDPEDGFSHSAKVAWRALAMLQEELETQGAPMPRGARNV